MNLMTGESADEFFGGDVPTAVRDLLHRAAVARSDERATLLWSAQALWPGCLAVYFVLYKHHAGRREFDLAERAATRGLREAAATIGLPDDWRLVATPLPPAACDSGPGRFWLFTIKALAFIHLRRGHLDEARALLGRLEACDPQARIGADVLASLLDATEGRSDRSAGGSEAC